MRKRRLRKFVKLIHEKKPRDAEIREISVEDYEGGVMPIKSYYRYLTASQLSKIIFYRRDMLERQDEMLEKQDLMLRKQDDMLQEIKGLRNDLKAVLDERLGRIERDIAEIKAKLKMP